MIVSLALEAAVFAIVISNALSREQPGSGGGLDTHDVGSRDTIYKLAGVTCQAIDYADGLVRVGVQSAIPHPEAAALLREYMTKAGLKVPPPGRTLDSICVTPSLCR